MIQQNSKKPIENSSTIKSADKMKTGKRGRPKKGLVGGKRAAPAQDEKNPIENQEQIHKEQVVTMRQVFEDPALLVASIEEHSMTKTEEEIISIKAEVDQGSAHSQKKASSLLQGLERHLQEIQSQKGTSATEDNLHCLLQLDILDYDELKKDLIK